MQSIPWQQQAAEIWKILLETSASAKDTDRKFQETDRKFQETDRKIKELAELFTGQWGKLVEALLSPGCVKIFKEAGIRIEQSCANLYSEKEGGCEIDVLLVNTDEVVAIEVKTTATVSHVKHFLKVLEKFKTYFPQYSGYAVYGAVAALRYTGESDVFASKNGLFVIEPHGEGFVRLKKQNRFRMKKF